MAHPVADTLPPIPMIDTLNSTKNANRTKKLNIDDEYNPFEHRNLKHPNSDLRSLANLVKSSLGSGILAMPLAFKTSGLITGVIGTLIIGLICTYCAHILVKVSQELCKILKKPSLGYGDICEQVFANGPKSIRRFSKSARISADCALILTCLGACCVYVVLMSNSIKQLVENSYPSYIMEVPIYCMTLIIPLILTVQINNLKFLAPFSALANVFLITVCGISFYFIFDDFPSLENRNIHPTFSELPLFLSTVIFAMEGICVVMPIENAMANPAHFLGCPGVLNISMGIVVFLYGSLGFFGYAKYGEFVLGSITLNLPMESVLAQVAKILIVIAIFFTYTLPYYVAAEIAWKYLEPVICDRFKILTHIMLLCTGVVFTVCIGAALPKIEEIIELVGAIFYSTLGLFIPCLIETIFKWNTGLGKWNWILWKNVLIMIFSMVALLAGVGHALAGIIS